MTDASNFGDKAGDEDLFQCKVSAASLPDGYHGQMRVVFFDDGRVFFKKDEDS